MRRILLISLLLIIGVIALGQPKTIFANDPSSDFNNNYDIDISLSPSDVLFNVENMKPGDWAPRVLTVENNGRIDFEYHMSISNEGDAKLFNEFILEIKDSESTIYNGKLSDVDILPKRFLAAKDTEDLQFTIHFPEGLGNEFQGLGVSFKMIFVAEGIGEPGGDKNDSNDTEKDKSPNDKDVEQVDGIVNNGDNSGGGELPDTAANMFNFMIIGIYLLLAGGLILMISKRRKSRVRRI